MENKAKYLAVLVSLSYLFVIVSSVSLPLVDPGLFVIKGVSTCGSGNGYCLLSNSCLVDSDFEADTDNGHCDGLKHAFNPNANFVCCKQINPTSTSKPSATIEDTYDSTNTYVTTLPPPPPALVSVTDASKETDLKTDDETSAITTSTASTAGATKKTVSPFNIAASTNKILNSIQHLLQGGRMRPSVALNKHGQETSETFNDKSLVNLILLGLNVTKPNRNQQH